MTLHTHWNHEFYSSLLGDEAIFFSILRRPADAYASMFDYANFKSKSGMNINDYIDK